LKAGIPIINLDFFAAAAAAAVKGHKNNYKGREEDAGKLRQEATFQSAT